MVPVITAPVTQEPAPSPPPEQPLQEAAAKTQKMPHFALMEVVTSGYSWTPGLLNDTGVFRVADSLTTIAF